VELRNSNRYGIFKANSSIGIIKIDISISGWFENIRVFKDKHIIKDIETDENDYYEETADCIDLGINYIDGKNLIIEKPFLKCLKRYK